MASAWPFVLAAERASDNRIRHYTSRGFLPARRSRSQHVQAQAPHHRRQPSPQVADAADIAAAGSIQASWTAILRLARPTRACDRRQPEIAAGALRTARQAALLRSSSHSSTALRHRQYGHLSKGASSNQSMSSCGSARASLPCLPSPEARTNCSTSRRLAKVPATAALPRGGWSALGVLEMVCAILLIVPAATRWMPVLTPVAATALVLEAWPSPD